MSGDAEVGGDFGLCPALDAEFDGAGSATLATGETVPYTYDEATLTLCIAAPDRQRCLTFAEANPEPKAGDATRYTADDGAEGTATILEVTP